MAGHIINGHARRRLNPKKRWVPVPRTTPQPVTLAHLAYCDVLECAPGVPVGYGITRGGPWARVGDMRIRASTPEAALREALAKHIEVAHG